MMNGRTATLTLGGHDLVVLRELLALPRDADATDLVRAVATLKRAAAEAADVELHGLVLACISD